MIKILGSQEDTVIVEKVVLAKDQEIYFILTSGRVLRCENY